MALLSTALRRGSLISFDVAASFSTTKDPNALLGTPFVVQLFNDPNNKSAVDRFMKHPLHTQWSTKGLEKDPLGAKKFQSFTLYDYHYHANRIRIKAALLQTVPTWDLNGMKAVQDSITRNGGYMEEWYNKAVVPSSKLVNPQITIEEIQKAIQDTAGSPVVDEYIQSNVAWTRDPSLWLEADLISIACLYGWSIRAVEYENDPNTAKSGLYYEVMIKPYLKKNADGTILKIDGKAQIDESAEKIAGLIQKDAKAYTFMGKLEDPLRVSMLFQRGLELEALLLDFVNK